MKNIGLLVSLRTIVRSLKTCLLVDDLLAQLKKKNIENIKEVMLEICQISSSKDSSRRLLSSLV